MTVFKAPNLSGIRRWRAIGAVSLTCLFAAATGTPVAAQEAGKLGFVMRDFFTAVYNTKFMDECPEGITAANDELWWRGMTKEARAKATNNGLVQALNRARPAINRGPDNTDICFNPTIIKDPP